jgi:hypothetical protein
MIEEGRGAYEKVRRGYGAGARGGPGRGPGPVGRKLNEAAACSLCWYWFTAAASVATC